LENLLRTLRMDDKRLVLNYIFCTALNEVLPQLHFFPTVCDDSVSYLVTLAFKEVAYTDHSTYGSKYNSYLMVTERFTEVLGVLSHTHGAVIQRAFMNALNELRKENPITPYTMNCIIALRSKQK
uniref:MOR2-PAG1_N domain-containing protein n=1 Tax=Gongylonema pulchrum TaxID=637853 RepID=A0A183E4T0_9BILA